MNENESIEIPFGAIDSELKGWEYTIPEGMEAVIRDGKIIVREKDSEDERISKEIVGFLDVINKDSLEARKFIADRYGDAIPDDMIPTWIAWLEKQGSHIKFLQSIQIGDEVTRNPDGVLVNLSQFKRKAEQGSQNPANSAKTCKDEQKPVNIDYISGIRKELLSIEDDAKNINGLTESQWVAIRAAYRSLGEYITKEQNPAWSEEDEQYLLVCKNALAKYQTTDKWDAGIISHWLEDRLKLFKERYTWKPSDEQMEALGKICEWISLPTAEILDEIHSLYNELKKLKG